MADSYSKHAVGVFSNRDEVEQALSQLQSSGFSMDHVSVVAKNVAEQEVAGAEVSDRVGDQNIKTATGAVSETLTHAANGTVLLGLTSLAIPGVGPILAAGTLGAALVAGVASVGVGLGATNGLINALKEMGIPEDQSRRYSDRLLLGNYLVIIHDTGDSISQAESVLSQQGIQDWGVYNSAQTASAS